jgi:two-component system cell cycle sensor histidine kinase/response regulator CckA
MSKIVKNKKTRKSINLSRQIETLRAQLAESQDTLEAIRSGGVDALIVNCPDGNRVYTLQGADYGYQIMIENMMDGAVTVSAEGQILYGNSAFARIVGKPLDQVLGANLQEFTLKQDIPVLNNLLRRGFKESSRGELTLVRGGTGEIPVHFTVNVLPNGSAPNLCVIVSDLSERLRQESILRRQEEELQQSRKMEAIGRLAGGVAHDFNNLVTGIIGLGEDLKQSMSLDDPRRSDMEEIIQAGQRAFSLTKQLLAFGKRQMATLEILNLNAIILDMSKLLKRVLGESVHLNLQLSDIASIKADRGQAEQVLMNIILNARDAMGGRGTITIHTENFTHVESSPTKPFAVAPGSYVVLSITDTGPGIPSDVLCHIFEPFFTTKKEKGTGLGLATVYGIVKQLGGDIRVQTEAGKGTTFKMCFPALAEKRHEPRRTPVDLADGGQETILVVEDEDIVRRVVVRKLQNKGYHVLEAHNGRQAVELSREYGDRIRLVISDVVMPDSNGPETIAAIRKYCPHLSVLYMSGYAEDILIEGGVVDPNIEFVAKTAIQTDLLLKVRRVIEKHPAVRS